MHIRYNILFILSSIVLFSSCATLKPSAFQSTGPKLDPIAFFGGTTTSYGAVEARNGKPSQEITTKTTGTVKDGMLYIEQDLFPKGDEPNHRSWQLKQVDEHHVISTANDISGTAKGELYGNYFTWTFRLKVKNRKIIRHVRMNQQMYLMPDGNTLLIRSVIRKFGVRVLEISEVFQKG